MTAAQKKALQVLLEQWRESGGKSLAAWVVAGKRRSYDIGDHVRPFGRMNHRHVNMIAAEALARKGYADVDDAALRRAAAGTRTPSEIFGCTRSYRITDAGRAAAKALLQEQQ